jgi:hypothetical protein
MRSRLDQSYEVRNGSVRRGVHVALMTEGTPKRAIRLRFVVVVRREISQMAQKPRDIPRFAIGMLKLRPPLVVES